MGGISELDILIVQHMQGLGEWLLPLMKIFSELAYMPVYILVLCWCWNYTLGIRLAVLMGFSGACNELLKIIFHAPRPYMVDERVIQYGNATGFGMPSGHAQASATFWGYLAAHKKVLGFRIAAIVMICVIGLSRIYLGVHSPTQVLLGWGIGIVLVGIVLLLERKASGWWAAQSTVFQIVLFLDLAILVILLAFLKLYFYRNMPESIYAVSRTHVLSSLSMVALISGVGVGGILLNKKHQFSVQLSWGKQALKILIGFCSLAIFAASLLFAKKLQEQFIPICLYLGMTNLIMGFWMSYLAPLLFLKFGLFEEKTS